MLSRILCMMVLVAGLSAQQAPAAPASPAGTPQSSAPGQQGFRISGIAVNSLTGQPLAGASVAIAPLAQGSERDVTKSVVTAADGRFAFSPLRQGKYSLMAMARGFSLQYFDHHDVYATAIAVGPGLDSEHLVFRLQPDTSIEGVVTDENNDPVQYAMVRLFQTSTEGGEQKTRPVRGAQTDDQGHYLIGHLAPGAYYLVVSARPWYAQNVRPPRGLNSSSAYAEDVQQEDAALDVTYPLTFYPDATDSANASPIQLAAGARETADVVMRAVPSLHLRIHTPPSSQGAVIGRMIFPRVSQRIFDGYIDSMFNAPDSWIAPGVLEISGLAPGHYVIELSPSSGINDKGNGKAWYREIDLTGDADINAAEGAGFVTVTGTILFENSRVPKHAFIELINPETGERFNSSISTGGEFDFNSDDVRPGRYAIQLVGGESFYLKKLVATGAKVAGRAIEIGSPGNVHLAIIASRGEAQVEGTVIREGQPFSGAMVVLVPQDPGNNAPLFRRDQSDSDGTFTLSHVAPGQYTVIALANGWDLEWANPTVLQPYLKGGQTVQVPPDGKLNVKVSVE